MIAEMFSKSPGQVEDSSADIDVEGIESAFHLTNAPEMNSENSQRATILRSEISTLKEIVFELNSTSPDGKDKLIARNIADLLRQIRDHEEELESLENNEAKNE